MNPRPGAPPRPYLGVAALWLAALAVTFVWVLAVDSTEPERRWLWGAGLALLPPAVACCLAALVPWFIARESLWLAAQGMMLLSGGLGLLLLLAGAVQAAGAPQLLVHYAAALALLALTLVLFWFRLRTAGRAGLS